MDEFDNINVQVNEQVINIESPVIVLDVKQQTDKVIGVQPTTVLVQPINNYITPIWNVINIDRTNETFYFIQSKLDNEDEYKIQRINKSTYEIDYNYSDVDEWLNRTTLSYE